MHERALAVLHRKIAFAVAGDDLPQERDFFHSAPPQFAALGHDVGNAPAALLASGVGHDAEGAILVAPLHDADERGHGFRAVARKDMLAYPGFARFLLRHVHDAFPAASQQIPEILRRAVKLLRAQDKIDVGQPIDQFLAPALRHAAQEAKKLAGPVFLPLANERGHLAHRLLFRQVAHAARVQQHHIRHLFGRRQGVALAHQLRRDRFAVALVHLASVGFDKHTGHGPSVAGKLRQPLAVEKAEDAAGSSLQRGGRMTKLARASDSEEGTQELRK